MHRSRNACVADVLIVLTASLARLQTLLFDFAIALRGSASTIRTAFGSLKLANRRASLRRTHRYRSRRRLDECNRDFAARGVVNPHQRRIRTPGYSRISASTSSGYTLKPPLMISSLSRPITT